MLANKLLVLAVCGMGVIEPVMAEDQSAGAQYSPGVRLLSDGQYRAEVWRRNDKGQEEFVGTNYKPHANAAKAMDDACLSVRKHFEPSFSCPRTPADQQTVVSVPEPEPLTANKKAGDRPVAATTKTGSAPVGRSAAAGKAASVPEAAEAKRGVVPAATMTSNSSSSQWGWDFWANQLRWSGGGGDGGGGGGGTD
jgi:hypothetical protein